MTALRTVCIALAALVLSAAAAAPSTAPVFTGTPCDKLIALTIPDVTITAAAPVAAGPFTTQGMRQSAELPAFCRVQGVAAPTADSHIQFEVWIPQAGGWNGKFQEVGVGGYDGSISYDAMAAGLKRGYAVAGNDVGHTGGDLKFGLGHPEKVIDWAWRAMHVSAVAGKLIVRNATGRQPEHSYFIGCSTGGHQALSEAQRFPADFDGIIAGDPAYDRLHETAAYLWSWTATHDASGAPLLSSADLKLVTQAVVATCGDRDGVIDEPRLCRFAPATLLCKPGQTGRCLNQEQVDAVDKVYAGLRNPRTGEQIFPGWERGSENFGDAPLQGWNGFLINPKAPMRSEVYAYFLFGDPNWDFRTFDFDRDVAYADSAIGYMSAVDTDLGAFRARGGKLLMYTGWIDPVAPPEDIAKYYDAVAGKMGGLRKVAEFYRFFMVPGMGHCQGGPGTTNFDMLTQLENWVEHGRAPARVVASHVENGVTTRTRPLCPYPQVARWNGKGDRSKAESFLCTAAKKS
ncbi:MAG: tannase/feruloyl esterase family alpha/beta hydrolase [Rhizomicrobium sp.]